MKHTFGKVIKNKLVLTCLLLFTLLVALFVVAEVGRSIDISSINTTSGSSTAGGGFVLSGTSGFLTNGSGFPVVQAAEGVYLLNLSGSININVSLIRNLSHGGFVNLTFGWMLSRTNASTMLNTTLYNSTGNQTSYNYSFSTTLLPDGIYNVSIYVQNASTDTAFSGNIVVNFSRAVDVAVDNTPPNVTNFWANVSNTTNLTTTAAKIEINISSNDSVTYVQAVKIGVRNGTSEMNLTATRNASAFGAVIMINASLGQDRFNVFAYANDSLGNLNFTNGNFTFTVDGTAPSFLNFSVMYKGVASGNITNISNSTPTFYINFTDNLSVSANCTVYVNVTLSLSNGATPNATMTSGTAATALAEGHHISYVSCTDGSGNQGNNTDAVSATSATTIFFVSDTIPPNVTFFTNISNGTNLSFATTSGVDFGAVNFSIILNATSNDSATYTQTVKFGVRNGSTEMNLTASRGEGNFFANLSLNGTLSDDVYIVTVYRSEEHTSE